MARGGADDGGIETSLSFHDGFDFPCFASFPLLGDGLGRAGLRRCFETFLDMAQERGLRFVLDTATWRANSDWGRSSAATRARSRLRSAMR
jgi:homocysteine S-methyltransferase